MRRNMALSDKHKQESEAENVIEAKGLTKCYGKNQAVSNLSFKAEKGRVIGFLGPNGAGKSTTMNMLTGYISATKGDVFINGVSVIDNPDEAKKSIGYLPEIPPLYADMTVREYLEFVAALKKVKKSGRTEMLADVMQRTGVDEVGHRLVKHLSKGFRQRVGLAGALIGYPEVLILDEPTVGLDPKQIIDFRALIKELSAEHTIIISSHILSEISEVCDEIMIINHGNMIAVGTPEELTQQASREIEIQIDVNCEKEAAEEIFGRLDGLKKAELTSENGQGILSYSLFTDMDKDIRPELFFAFADAKTPLLKIIRIEKSLEDIFLAITDGDGKNGTDTASDGGFETGMETDGNPGTDRAAECESGTEPASDAESEQAAPEDFSCENNEEGDETK